MKKRFYSSVFFLLFFSVSCKSSADVSFVDNESVADADNEVSDFLSDDEVEDDNSVDNVPGEREYPDIDTGPTINKVCDTGEGCEFDTLWMLPEEDWKSWAFAQAVGKVGDDQMFCCSFQYSVGDMQNSSTKSGNTRIIDAGDNVDLSLSKMQWPVGDAYPIIALEDVFLRLSFDKGLIPYMKSEKLSETGYGPDVEIYQKFFKAYEAADHGDFEILYKTIDICCVGIAKLESSQPVGSMYGCFENNVDGSDGEYLKMMFRMEIETDRDKILDHINTRIDGTKAVKGDEDFKEYCKCSYSTDEKSFTCNYYDGIGERSEVSPLFPWE